MNTHVSFNGNCEEAFKFYEKALNGKITFLMNYDGTPAAGQVPADWGKKVIHAALSVNGGTLQGCDAPPDRYEKPQGFSVALDVKEAPEAERAFKALSEGASICMPMQETFWAQRFGMLTDRFGIPWMVNCSKPM
ncbi:MAG TPA: VOC family protein [Candidatus Binatia bacterium]|nr:VOC family protein [Candidatus Binatia bacterium]